MTFSIKSAQSVDPKADLGSRIIEAREALGLSTAQLARRLGISTPTLAKWENGAADPRTNRLVTLAGMLGVSPTWLLSGLGDGPAAQTADAEIEALQNGVIEMRNLHRQMGERVADLEHRLDALRKSA